MSYTKQALIEQQVIKLFFPTLAQFYQPHMGNFAFRFTDFLANSTAILRWLGEFKDYRIVCESYDNDEYYYLTNFS